MQTVRRLYDYFHPTHYDLTIETRRIERVFRGTVTLRGTKLSEDAPIVLHANDLSIAHVRVDTEPVDFTLSGDELTLHEHLSPGDYMIEIIFSGKITDSMHGLYPCYFEHDGVKKELLATQFESHHAREVFPCIDEPEAKATFALTLRTEAGVTVLSNMPLRAETTRRSTKISTFDTTPRMSTYLLAFVIGELHGVSGTSTNGVQVAVWASSAQPAAHLQYGLDMSLRLLDFYEDYFGVPFPLPKIDHVALPDFDAGAMENWGLITYREITLLADAERSSLETRQYVASVISHELSHQWFGNLVTMRWWNDLWLNESFARIMEYLPFETLEPSWLPWEDFTINVSGGALARDALCGIQPVQAFVHHPDEIHTLFDPYIVYSKGARLVRMVQQYLGENAFREGLQRYFTQYAYGNTTADELWEALSSASGKDIRSMMHAWIEQPGYPVVAADDGALQQEQFFIGSHTPSSSLWPIPLGDPANTIITKKSQKLRLAPGTLLNHNDGAHFIAQYSEAQYELIAKRVANGTLSAVDQTRLLTEQVLLARGARSSSTQTITLLKAYRNSPHPTAWQAVENAVASLQSVVGEEAGYLRAFVGWLAHPQFERLGLLPRVGETHTEQKLRPSIVRLMAYAEQARVIAEAESLLANTNFLELPSDTRASIAGVSVADGMQRDVWFNSLYDTYVATVTAEVKRETMQALALTKDPNNISRLLEAMRQGVVRPLNVRTLVRQLMNSPHAKKTTWNWLRSEWYWIQETFGSDMSYSDYPMMAASALSTQAQLEEYRVFFNDYSADPRLTRSIRLGDILLGSTVEHIRRDQKNVLKSLHKSETMEQS